MKPTAPMHPDAPWRDYILAGTDLVREVVDEIEKVEKPDFRLVTTGCKWLDDAVTLIPGTVTTLAARPGGGKTTFCEYMTVRELAALTTFGPANGCVIYVSLETPAFLLGMHIGRLGQQGFVARDIYRKRVDLADAKKAALRSALDFGNLYVIRRPKPSGGRVSEPVSSNIIVRSVEEIAFQWGKKPTLIVLDFIQRLDETRLDSRASRSIRENIIAGMVAAATLAEQTGAMVLVAAQASREVDNMIPPIPQLGNILESSAIEQLSDGVWGLGRPITSGAIQKGIRDNGGFQVSARPDQDGEVFLYSVTKSLMMVQAVKCRHDPPGGMGVFNLAPATLELTDAIPDGRRTESGEYDAPSGWMDKSWKDD